MSERDWQKQSCFSESEQSLVLATPARASLPTTLFLASGFSLWMLNRIPPVLLGAFLFKEGVAKEKGKCTEKSHRCFGNCCCENACNIITRGTWMLTLGTARLQRRQRVEKKGLLTCCLSLLPGSFPFPSDVSLPKPSIAVLLLRRQASSQKDNDQLTCP